MTVSEQIDAFIEQHGGNCRDALNVALARLEIMEAAMDRIEKDMDLLDDTFYVLLASAGRSIEAKKEQP
jgi:hypothetical protein